MLILLPPPQRGSPASVPLIVPSQSNLEPVAQVTFEDVTADWMVFALHKQISESLSSLPEALGSGICVADFNGDGWMDLFFIGGSGYTRHYGGASWWHASSGNRLLINESGTRLRDMTHNSGLEQPMQGMGCGAVDMNDDRLIDLIVTSRGGTYLYRNLGAGRFVDVTANSGLLQDHWSMGVSIGDFNKDGKPDFYISNYVLFNKGQKTFERNSGFSSSNAEFDPTLYDPEPNRLYINTGDFQFEEQANQLGVANGLGRSLGARWVDINQDSWLDLMVINDRSSSSRIFINNQGTQFESADSGYAPFELPGVHDVVIDNADDSHVVFITRSIGSPPALIEHADQQQDSRLQKTRFTDTAWNRGLADTQHLYRSFWGATSGDFNNDGFNDLFIASGTLHPDMSSPFVTQGQHNWLFLKDKQGQYLSLPQQQEAAATSTSRSVVKVDLDNDGRLELIVGNNNNPMQILANTVPSSQHWIGLDLLSANAFTAVEGAEIEIITEHQTIRRRAVVPTGFLSQSDARVHIGLGANEQIKSLNITWPDGTLSRFTSPPVGRYLIIDKSQNHWMASPTPDDELIAFRRAVERLDSDAKQYLSLALVRANPELVYKKLRYLWPQLRSDTQIKLLLFMNSDWAYLGYPFVQLALDQHDPELRLTAISKLRRDESEYAVRLLLPLLDDPDPTIQCAVAAAFGFFFNEEEAVTQRKQLAIPELIRLLDSPSLQAQICALDALAAAENIRASVPLQHLVLHSHHPEVQAAAIRTLGLIRDSSGSSVIVQVASKPETSAHIIANSLIALKRLNDPQLTHLINNYFEEQQAAAFTADSIRPLDILQVLMDSAESGVFSRSVLQDWLNTTLHSHPIPSATNTPEQQRYALQALDLIRRLDAPVEATILDQLSTSSSAAIRAKVWALWLQKPLSAAAAIKTTRPMLKHESFETLTRLLNEPQSLVGRFSDLQLSQLVEHLQQERVDSHSLIDVLNAVPAYSQIILLRHWIENQPLTPISLPILELCRDPNIYLSFNPHLDFRVLPPAVAVAYTRCVINQPQNNEGVAALQRRVLLNYLLGNNAISDVDKFELGLKAAEQDPIVLETMLINRWTQLQPDQRASLVTMLEANGQLQKIETQLKTQMHSSQLTQQNRFKSAMYLMALDTTQTMLYLESLVSSHD